MALFFSFSTNQCFICSFLGYSSVTTMQVPHHCPPPGCPCAHCTVVWSLLIASTTHHTATIACSAFTAHPAVGLWASLPAFPAVSAATWSAIGVMGAWSVLALSPLYGLPSCSCLAHPCSFGMLPPQSQSALLPLPVQPITANAAIAAASAVLPTLPWPVVMLRAQPKALSLACQA